MIKQIDLYYKSIDKVVSKNDLSYLVNKKILITGINGMIGSAIIDVLNYLNEYKKYNIQIIGFVRNENNTLERFKKYNNLKIYKQDVNEKVSINENIDYIINAASNADPAKFSSNPVETMVTNFLGTKNLLDYGIAHKCSRIVYVSSGEIYGQGSSNIESFDEEYRGYICSTNYRSCYPISKQSAETLCCSYARQHNIDCVIVRPSHTYGPTQKDTDSRASSQFIMDAINGNDIIMKSDGKQIRSYTYVLDCVTGILMSLIYGENCEAYNVANKKSVISIREMAEEIANVNGKKVIVKIPTNKEKSSFNPVTRSVLNGTKLEKIGWIPCYNFKDGINATIKIMK